MRNKQLIHEGGHARAYLKKVKPDKEADLPIIFINEPGRLPKKEILPKTGDYTIPVYFCSFDDMCDFMIRKGISVDFKKVLGLCVCPELTGTDEENKKIQIYISKAGYKARRAHSILYYISWAIGWLLLLLILLNIDFNNLKYTIIALIGNVVYDVLLYFGFRNYFGFGEYFCVKTNKRTDALKIRYLKKNGFSGFYDVFPTYYDEANEYAKKLDYEIKQSNNEKA